MILLAVSAMSLSLLNPAPVAEPIPAPVPAPVVVQDKPSTQRYCVVYTPTGTLFPTRLCRTRTDWLDRGFDPLTRP